MRWVLDTGAFFYPDALRRLPRGRLVVVPATTFIERARQLKRDGRASPSAFHRSLAHRGWVVEPMTEAHSLRAAYLAPADEASWGRLARDVLVASHVREDDILLSPNVEDFIEIGLRPDQVRDPALSK